MVCGFSKTCPLKGKWSPLFVLGTITRDVLTNNVPQILCSSETHSLVLDTHHTWVY